MKKTILVIEDDQGILDATEMALQFEGYHVMTADSGEYANELTSGKAPLPHLVLLDILLSGQDGRLICKKLKSSRRTAHLPIIMMSAHPNAEKSVREAGADFFLPKPFSIDDLVEAVKKLV
jgi:DNA-binding response OmpR family regulator